MEYNYIRYRNKSSIVAVGGKIVAATKKARQSRSNVKVLIVVFDGNVVVHHEFVPRGQTVNGVLLGGHGVFEGGRAKEVA
jgi:hypothetical protein